MRSTVKITAMIALTACWLLAAAAPIRAGQSLTARQILDKIDDLFRGKSSQGRMTMAIVTANWKRTLALEFWSKGKDKTLMRILSPKKEKGTATLRSGHDIWNYLPKVKRTIKLPSSMMSSSWMGSHFTNDDLVKESRMADDYEYDRPKEGVREGKPVYEITCVPKPEAAVVWGKVVVILGRTDYLPLEIGYYDEDLKLARTMTFARVDRMGDRVIPTLMTVLPEDKPGEKTEVLYNEIIFNLDVPDDTFSLRNLQR